MCEVIFVLALGLLFYCYVGYFFSLVFLNFLFPFKERQGPSAAEEVLPSVTIIVCAYNEEGHIEGKIENCLQMKYPAELIQIIIVSDSSTDRTEELVAKIKDDRILLLLQKKRQGKTAAENFALPYVTGDIVVFSDASCLVSPDALKSFASIFTDNNVGCVSSVDKSEEKNRKNKIDSSESSYVDFEMKLRGLEDRFLTLVGASGSCYAARRELFEEIPARFTRDFHLPMSAFERGFKTTVAHDAWCLVTVNPSARQELRRKERTITNGLNTLFSKAHLLSPITHPRYAFLLICHKLCRWLSPFFWIMLIVTNVALVVESPIWIGFLVGQFLFIALGIFHWKTDGESRIGKWSSFPYYFCMANFAALRGWKNFFLGNTHTSWNPTNR